MDDYGVVTAPRTVQLVRLLPGPIERIWSYLTDPQKRADWLAAGEMELRVGGRVELIFNNNALTENDDPPPPKYAKHAGESRLHGVVTACTPPSLLAYTWGEGSDETSEVRFELSARGEKVLLMVTHSRLVKRDEMISVAGGWHAHLGILAARLEGRTPAGFWATHTRLEAEYEKRIPVDS